MRKYLAAAAALVVLVVLQQAGIFWRPPPSVSTLHGAVTQKDQAVPATGAYVAARWLQSTGFSTRVCRHLEVAKVDSEGFYNISTWAQWKNFTRTHIELTVYFPGHQVRSVSKQNNKWESILFEGRMGDYLEELWGLRLSCNAADGSSSNGIPYWEALLREVVSFEARHIELTPDERNLIYSIKSHATSSIIDPERKLDSNQRDEKITKLLEGLR